MQAKYSLKRQLLLWLLIPQLVLWLAGALLSFQVASHVANVMTDTSLQQTANALARQVHVRPDGQVTFDFPPAARDLLQGSLDDALMYRISTLPGGVLASNGQFEDVAAPTPTASHPEFYTSKKNKDGTSRALSVFYPLDHTGNHWLHVEVARNQQGRKQLSDQIMLTIGLPLGGLLIVMSVLVWVGINRGLKPLSGLQNLLENRRAQNLAPFELSDAPEEVHALTHALNQLLSTTNESVARQRRFIADAAHQLRTPLAGLKSQTELAMRETTVQGLGDRLNMVHTSATRSIHLVNQLLTWRARNRARKAACRG